MPIVKISVHRLNAERSLKAKGGQVKINNNVSIKMWKRWIFLLKARKA